MTPAEAEGRAWAVLERLGGLVDDRSANRDAAMIEAIAEELRRVKVETAASVTRKWSDRGRKVGAAVCLEMSEAAFILETKARELQP